MIWIMKSGRLPCQNVFMGTDQVRTAVEIRFSCFRDRVVFRTPDVGYASSDIDYS